MKDEWAVKEILQADTGKVERIYTYKRKPCNRVVLKSKLALQFDLHPASHTNLK
jgi:hypothetical protein